MSAPKGRAGWGFQGCISDWQVWGVLCSAQVSALQLDIWSVCYSLVTHFRKNVQDSKVHITIRKKNAENCGVVSFPQYEPFSYQDSVWSPKTLSAPRWVTHFSGCRPLSHTSESHRESWCQCPVPPWNFVHTSKFVEGCCREMSDGSFHLISWEWGLWKKYHWYLSYFHSCLVQTKTKQNAYQQRSGL